MALTTQEAAERLRVTTHEVRRLLTTGDLRGQTKGRIWLVDEDSVDERNNVRLTRGRALAAHTAWAALFEASGERATWLDVQTRSRMRAWLRRQDAASLAAGCRRRADRHALRVLPAYRDRLLSSDGVLRGGISGAAKAGADLIAVAETTVEIYCDDRTLASLMKRYHLTESGDSNLTVRTPRWREESLFTRAALPAAVVAVDLMEATDFRTRRAGRALLTRLLRLNVASK